MNTFIENTDPVMYKSTVLYCSPWWPMTVVQSQVQITSLSTQMTRQWCAWSRTPTERSWNILWTGVGTTTLSWMSITSIELLWRLFVHSTEMALVKVVNDLKSNMDMTKTSCTSKHKCCLWHLILLDRFQNMIGLWHSFHLVQIFSHW